MREKKIIDLQNILYPDKYNTPYIYTYKSFNNELEELIGNSGFVKQFKTKYFKSLRFLEDLKKKCIMNSNLFEKLLHADGLYSIILKGEKNIRILFDFAELEENEIIILFNCFQEKRTKDYTDEIQIAKARRKEVLGI